MGEKKARHSDWETEQEEVPRMVIGETCPCFWLSKMVRNPRVAGNNQLFFGQMCIVLLSIANGGGTYEPFAEPALPNFSRAS